MFTLNIDLSALQTMLDERVPRAVLEQVDSKIGGWLKELVQKEAAVLINTTVQERVSALVRELLEQGWERTDDYGQSKGRFSLKEHVAKAVRDADRNRDITRVIQDAWDKELNTVWKKALEEMRETIRSQLVQKVADQLATNAGALKEVMTGLVVKALR